MTGKILVLLAACLCLLLSGCGEEAAIQRADLLINATVGGAAAEKTIAPPRNEMEIVSYTLEGKGPGGAALDPLTSSTGKFEVRNLLCGQWRFEAAALNANGKRIAKGRRTEMVGPGAKRVTIPMNEMPGIGRLELDFQIDGELSLGGGAEARLVVEIRHRETGTSASYERPFDGSPTRPRLVIESLHAGSYQVSATLYRNNDIMGSSIEVVRMLDGTLTKGHIALEVGEDGGAWDVDAVANVSTPVAGTIETRRLDGAGGEPGYLLTFVPEAGFPAETLSYKWYEGGNLIPGCDTGTCEVRPKKRSKYTLVVHSARPGSDASHTVTLDPIGGGGSEEPKSPGSIGAAPPRPGLESGRPTEAGGRLPT